MKKILGLYFSALMVLSAIAIPFAAENETDVSNGTEIELIGNGSEAYSVTVPAELQDGQTGTVQASGTWASDKSLKVTAPTSVTLTYGEKTMSIGIEFDGINLAGNDLEALSASADITVEDVDVLFGTWVGTLTYDVVLE